MHPALISLLGLTAVISAMTAGAVIQDTSFAGHMWYGADDDVRRCHVDEEGAHEEECEEHGGELERDEDCPCYQMRGHHYPENDEGRPCGRA